MSIEFDQICNKNARLKALFHFILSSLRDCLFHLLVLFVVLSLWVFAKVADGDDIRKRIITDDDDDDR